MLTCPIELLLLVETGLDIMEKYLAALFRLIFRMKFEKLILNFDRMHS